MVEAARGKVYKRSMPKPFDILDQLGKFGVERKISLRDPEMRSLFSSHVTEAVDAALADPTLMQGQRAEAMFEALLVSLGTFQMFTREDGGRIFPSERYIAPDYRVVLNDGAHWLVEVKNVYEADPFAQSRTLLKRDYYGKLAAYAAVTGADLKLAVFWARWSIWTLVSPEKLLNGAGDLTLDMMTAVKVNELARLGDMTIGTRAPLRLRLVADPSRTHPIKPDGTVEIVFGESQILCEDRLVLDPIEREIAWIFTQHGEWREQNSTPIIRGDRLEAIEFSWMPEELSDQGFDFVGSLSRMFARYYAAHTVQERDVVQLRAPLRPDWFAPLIRADYRGQALPLWRFTLQPNYPPFEPAADG